ncbi:MAG: DUF3696 domain-containing protein [Candidatus Saccharimonadaceae bacterium]
MLLDSIEKSLQLIQQTISNIYSLSSLRGNTERLYQNDSQIVDINKLLIRYLELDIISHESISQFIKDALRIFKIGDDISIERHQGVSSEIFIHDRTKKYLLADLGFGFTQLLPIILKIAIIAKENDITEFGSSADIYRTSVLLLEEPESNLHPSYQSLLADLIIAAADRFNIQFIIETHSEYFIRKLQYLTGNGDIKPADTSLYYFYHPNETPKGEKQVKKIEIQKDGTLSTEFGPGFFDEALNWKFELLKLKNKN